MEVTREKREEGLSEELGFHASLIIGQRLANCGLYFCDQVGKGVFHI